MFFLQSPYQKNLPRNMISTISIHQSTSHFSPWWNCETAPQPLQGTSKKNTTLHTGDAGLLGSFPSSAPARICCWKARKTQSSSNSRAWNVQTLGFPARFPVHPPTRAAMASKVAGRGSVRHPFDALQVGLLGIVLTRLNVLYVYILFDICVYVHK